MNPLHSLCGLLLLMCCPTAHATDSDSLRRHIGFKADVLPGRLIVMDEWQGRWQKNKRSLSFSAEATYTPLPQDSNLFAQDYNYPTFSLGLRWSSNDVTMHRNADFFKWNTGHEVDYDSRMGDIISLYSTFTRPLLRSRHWTVDYMLGAGIGYAHLKYDKDNNVDNELIGSHMNIYFTAGVHATWRFAHHWGLMAGMEYFHHSNGALNRPNKGANIYGPVVGLRYFPNYDAPLDNKPSAAAKPFKKFFYVNMSVGVGGKVLNEDWEQTQYVLPADDPDYRTGRFHFYTAYSLQADVMYRYARRWASGIGADLFYGTYADHVAAIDQANGYDFRHSPWSAGLALKHEVFYHNLSVNMSLGVYLFRHMGKNANDIEKPYYERIGINYTFPRLNHLRLGLNIKAHMTKADLTELVVSYPIKL